MSEKRYSLGEAGCYYTKLIIDNETKHELGNSIVVKTLNEQQEKITELELELTYYKNRKEQCNHKKVMLDFFNFMNMNNPLMEIMVDEFLEEIYYGENYERETI